MIQTLFRRPSQAAIRAVALMTALVGVLDFLSAITPALPERLEDLEAIYPLEVRTGGHVFAAFASFLLLTLAANLLRRKKLAWLLICLLLAVSIALHLLRGVHGLITALNGVVLLLLLAMAPAFTARSDPPSMRQGLRVLLLALLFTLAYGTLGFYLLDRHFSVRFDWAEAMGQTLAMFLSENNGGLQPRTRLGSAFAGSITGIGLLTLGYAVWMLLRPVKLRAGSSEADKVRAQGIVAGHARSSLAAFTLLADKALLFSPSGQSLIAFAARGRGAVALGDPIGPEGDQREAIAAFLQQCRRNDWQPAFYQVLPDHLDLYRSFGLRALKIGEEGIVDLTRFSLKGKGAQDLRTALNRLRKAGHRIEFHGPPVPDRLIAELQPVSEEWLQRMEGAEKRFSLGWFDRDYLRRTDVALVRTATGSISAFANLIVGVRPQEVMVDLMRNRSPVEPGTMDALFVSLFQHYQEAGFTRFSLGLSALSGLRQEARTPALETAMEVVSRHLDRFYSFQGLHAYKAKFHPVWEPRYLIYPNARALPEVLLALVQADSGDRLWDYLWPR